MSNCRVIFPKGKQKKFISEATNRSKLSNTKIAEILNVSVRTLADWKREKYSITESGLEKLGALSNLDIPLSIRIVSKYWYTREAAKLGAKATIGKYGTICTDPEKRRIGWERWWNQKGKYLSGNLLNTPKQCSKPLKSPQLAEFVGIVLGDGGITDYQITITLNKKDDREYVDFVTKLIRNLFQTTVSNNIQGPVVRITVSRKNLVKYCQKIGLKKGHKIRQQVDIPSWIMDNESYCIACLRGLVDTDGCVFRHRYKVNNKLYCYNKLAYSSRSKPLLSSVSKILNQIGINPRIDCRGDIRLDNTKDVKRYFDIVGSSNPKHIGKMDRQSWKGARVA